MSLFFKTAALTSSLILTVGIFLLSVLQTHHNFTSEEYGVFQDPSFSMASIGVLIFLAVLALAAQGRSFVNQLFKI